MPDVSLIHPLLRLAFPGFNFLALGCLLMFTFITDYSPLLSRVYSGFLMSVYVFSRFQVTIPALFVLTLLSIPLDVCYLYTPLRSVSSFYRLYCRLVTWEPMPCSNTTTYFSPRLRTRPPPAGRLNQPPRGAHFVITTRYTDGRYSIQSEPERGSRSCHPSKARLHPYTAFRIVEFAMRLDVEWTPRSNTK